jgi:hypothetical protein
MSLGIGKAGNWILRKINKYPLLDRAVDRISSPACRLLGGTPRLTRDMFNLYQRIQRARNVDPRAVREIEIRSDGFYAKGPGNELMKMGSNPLGEHFPEPVVLRLELDTPEQYTKYMRGLRGTLRQYKKRGGDLGFYTKNILPLLIKNAKTPEELKIWGKEIKELLVISLKVFGKINLVLPKISRKINSLEDIKGVKQAIVEFCRETRVIGGDFEHIFLRTVEKVGPLRELRDWLGAVEEMIKDFRPEIGDRPAYIKVYLPRILRRAGSLEELEEAKLLIMEYIKKYGDPLDFIKEIVIPFLSLVRSIEKLKEARFLIGDYIEKGFDNPIGYARDCVLRLVEDLSEEKLRVIREFVIDCDKKIGSPRDIIEYAIYRILDKAYSPEELRQWCKEIKTMILDFVKKFRNSRVQVYVRTPLRKLLNKVKSTDELSASSFFIVTVGNEIGDPEPYMACIEFCLLAVLDKVIFPQEIREWAEVVRDFILDTEVWFKNPRECVENTLPAIIANAKSPKFLEEAKFEILDFSKDYGYQRRFVVDVVPRLMTRAGTIEELRAWYEEVSFFTRDCRGKKEKMHNMKLIIEMSIEMLDDYPTLAHFVVARSLPFIDLDAPR